MSSISIVGVQEDGCLGLPAKSYNAVCRSQVLVGNERTFAFFPEYKGEKIDLGVGLVRSVDAAISRSYEQDVCVLASGDPMFYGIGGLVIRKAGLEHVTVYPGPSSMQLAFARAGVSWQHALVTSVHGRSLKGLVARLRSYGNAAILTDAKNSPMSIAARLMEYNSLGWDVCVCENLGGADERVRWFSLIDLKNCSDMSPLNVMVLKRQVGLQSSQAYLDMVPEESYAKRMPKKGLITKKEVRVLSLAALALRKNSVLWDIGAGSGSISIEASRLAVEGEIYALECDPEGVKICGENIRQHGADNVDIIAKKAPDGLGDLPDPDAVFIGGSKGQLSAIINECFGRLRQGGRLVVNAITMENISEARKAFLELGIVPVLSLIQVSRGASLAGKYMRYDALNPIHIFYIEKP